MALQAAFFKRTFTFNFDARTSRGSMKDKTSWFLKVWDTRNPDVVGLGECGPLPGLSPDHRPDFGDILYDVIKKIPTLNIPTFEGENLLKEVLGLVPPGFSSIKFGIETALLDLLNNGKRMIFNNGFVKGEALPINGLIWMGDADFMIQQIDKKIKEGYTCIKLKIGGLNFETECNLLRYIRNKFSEEQITLRLDANGAFDEREALEKITRLADFNIHSIEQPLNPSSSGIANLCRHSPIPIALDEALIGQENRKLELLKSIQPQYIVLKPTLHGGMQSCHEWISIATSLNIGWWITSALESNIGLNAVCQFTANYAVTLAQGLGTGMLYKNNFQSPLTVRRGEIFYGAQSWITDDLE